VPAAAIRSPAVSQEHHADGAVLAAVLPELQRFARSALYSRHLDAQLAEDVVSDAVERWLVNRIQYRSPAQLRAWMRTTIKRLVADQERRPARSRDMLDLATYSLSESWARGGS
jgi:DNA-directed RNA polymerase specialized sigma24 family protein